MTGTTRLSSSHTWVMPTFSPTSALFAMTATIFLSDSGAVLIWLGVFRVLRLLRGGDRASSEAGPLTRTLRTGKFPAERRSVVLRGTDPEGRPSQT